MPRWSKSKVKITVLRADGLPRIGTTQRQRRFYVSISINGVKQSTQFVRESDDGKAYWDNSSLIFDLDAVQGPSRFEVQLIAGRRVHGNECIGDYCDGVERLASWESRQDFRVPLRRITSESFRDESTPAVYLAIIRMESDTLGPMTHLTPTSAVSLLSASEAFAEGNTLLDVFNAWTPILTKLHDFSGLVDKIAEVHPYAKMAWSIVSIPLKIVGAQAKRDRDIKKLVDIVADVYSFMDEAESLQTVQSQALVLARIAQQTVDCCYFIRTYAADTSFIARALKNTTFMSHTDGQITQYHQVFAELKRTFKERAQLQTQIAVVRVLEKVQTIGVETDLNDMPYAFGASYHVEKVCQVGTRREILDEIADWVNNPAEDTQRVFLLLGQAGTGKSAIAHTIAHRFDTLQRLASSFCADRNSPEQQPPYMLLPTIAKDLADHVPQIKGALAEVIHNNSALRGTRSIETQFTKLILEPSKGLMLCGPVVIVIDALDECGEPHERAGLLSTLAERMSELPPCFRVLITSRLESDITDAFRSSQAKSVRVESMDSIDKASTTRDIRAYIDAQVQHFDDSSNFFSDKRREQLVKRSEGVFQWAFTSCEALKGNGVGLSRVERFNRMMSSSSRGGLLDDLYTEVLSQLFTPGKSHKRYSYDLVMARYRSVLGLVLNVSECVSIATLNQLRRFNKDDLDVSSILKPMGSLLSGVTEYSTPVRPFHTSFRDFLLDRSRSQSFYIDPRASDRDLALSSLQVMNHCLCFNICNLESSYIRNRDAHRLAERVRERIPSDLSYACRFWASHLENATTDAELCSELERFMFGKLLFWIEVVSLMRAISICPEALLLVAKWSKSSMKGEGLTVANLALDARKFVHMFASIILESTPHLYLSALPFAPQTSPTFQQYMPMFPRIPSVGNGRPLHWPAFDIVIPTQAKAKSVVFTPGNKLAIIVDAAVSFWDAQSGEHLYSAQLAELPLRGLISTAVSPDGDRVAAVSGHDNLVRIWKVSSEKTAFLSLQSSGSFNSIVAFSKDGRRIAVGSQDGHIDLRDLTDEGSEGLFWKGHEAEVTSLSFTYDGLYIISGSRDRTVRVFEASSGKSIGSPLYQGDAVRLVVVSPNGRRIASVSGFDRSESVRIWAANARGRRYDLLLEKKDNVGCVAFSPDGTRMVSGSNKTVQLWDVDSCKEVGLPLQGHTGFIITVAFSPDGTRIVSSSEDRSVRAWDANSSGLPLKKYWDNERVDPWTSVAFSPDSKHVVASLTDQTLMRWDVEARSYIGPSLARKFRDYASTIAFASDGRLSHAVSGSLDGRIHIHEVDNSYSMQMVSVWKGHKTIATAIAISMDGSRIASGSWDHTIQIWTGEGVGFSLRHDGTVNSVAFSPDGRQIVAAAHTIRVWDVTGSGGPESSPLKQYNRWVRSVALSPNGRHIASGTYDGSIRIFDVELGADVHPPLLGHTDAVTSVAYSNDGQYIASVSDDGTMRVWEMYADSTAEALVQDKVSIAFSSNPDHALCNPDQLFSNNCGIQDNLQDLLRLNKDGWIEGPHSELLLWVPPETRDVLWRPRSRLVVGIDLTELDLSRFAHGLSWYHCYHAARKTESESLGIKDAIFS